MPGSCFPLTCELHRIDEALRSAIAAELLSGLEFLPAALALVLEAEAARCRMALFRRDEQPIAGPALVRIRHVECLAVRAFLACAALGWNRGGLHGQHATSVSGVHIALFRGCILLQQISLFYRKL